MPRLAFDAETGWWLFPLDGEAAPIVWIGETWRGPDNPPGLPWVPEHVRALEQLDGAAPDEPAPEFENAGPFVGEELRYQWFEAAQAAHRGEYDPLGEGNSGFDPLQYEQGQTCTVPARHPPPGTIIGTPGVGSHSWTDPPNNWQSDNAVDIWLYPGTPVRACAAGRVSTSLGYGWAGPFESRFGGYRLHIEHASGMFSFYVHLEKLTVRRGAHVRRGQVIGRSGFGACVPHLHFAVTLPYDPRSFAAVTFDPNAPPNPGQPPQEPQEPPPRVPRRGPEQGWHNLMFAIGPDRRASRNRLRRARRAAKRSLE